MVSRHVCFNCIFWSFFNNYCDLCLCKKEMKSCPQLIWTQWQVINQYFQGCLMTRKASDTIGVNFGLFLMCVFTAQFEYGKNCKKGECSLWPTFIAILAFLCTLRYNAVISENDNYQLFHYTKSFFIDKNASKRQCKPQELSTLHISLYYLFEPFRTYSLD